MLGNNELWACHEIMILLTDLITAIFRIDKNKLKQYFVYVISGTLWYFHKKTLSLKILLHYVV